MSDAASCLTRVTAILFLLFSVHAATPPVVRDLTLPQAGGRSFTGVVAEGSDNICPLAGGLVELLRENLKNAALLSYDALLKDGVDARKTTHLIVLARPVPPAQRQAFEARLREYRLAGGRIIWVGAGLPGEAVTGMATGQLAHKPLAVDWEQRWRSDEASKNLLLLADEWPARYFQSGAATRQAGEAPQSAIAFEPAADQRWESLLRLVTGAATNVVGVAWPAGAPQVAYLPDYALVTPLWRDAKGASGMGRASAGSQFEALDCAFAALLGQGLPPELFELPPEYAHSRGAWRSPLSDADGARIETPAAWDAHRRALRARWHALMGPWPSIISNQVLQATGSEERENFVQHRVRFNWLPEESTDGYLLIPRGGGRRAAVITVFYEPETAIGQGGSPYRDYALQLARRGFVALSIGTREASRRQEFALYWPSIEDARVQPLSMLGYAAANACQALAGHPAVDPQRIGIVGHSFGGKWAMFAACLHEGFACGVWSDPGIIFTEERSSINYWEPWYLGYHPKPWRKRGMMTPENPGRGLYLDLRRQGVDLTDLHVLMAPRPFLVSGGAEDPPARWLPLRCSLEVNQLLGASRRVALSNRLLHSPNAEANRIVYNFLAHTLRQE